MTVGRRIASALALAVALAALALSTAAAAAPRDDGNFHGCGILVDAAHPWHSRVPGGTLQSGDHWIIARAGRLSTCAFAHVAVRKLLAAPERAYQGRDVGHLLGGLCDWIVAGGHERIRPFAEITCRLPTPRHPHIAAATARAFVDPDPRFIH